MTSVIPVFGPQRVTGAVSLDLRDADACQSLMREVRPSVVVHLAAQSSVGTTSVPCREVWGANFDGTRALFTAALALGLNVKFVFASSGEVYGDQFNRGACDEATPLAPMSTYARTKAACEYLLNDLATDHVPVVALRLFNHSGPGQDERFVVPSFAAQVAGLEQRSEGGQIKVGNLDATRDFSDVEDVIDAYLAVIRDERPLPRFSVFNVGSGHNRSIRSILDTLIGLARSPIEPIQDPARMRPVDVAMAQGVFERFREEFGWRPARSFDQTIAEVLEHQRALVASVRQ